VPGRRWDLGQRAERLPTREATALGSVPFRNLGDPDHGAVRKSSNLDRARSDSADPQAKGRWHSQVGWGTGHPDPLAREGTVGVHSESGGT
jgi:hypothetical protein